MRDFDPGPQELASLAQKYATLRDLRSAHSAGVAPPTDGSLRALARAFPGALRELDQLTLEEIERREAALRLASEGGVVEPWMIWIHGYHGALRASLFVKARAKRGAPIPAALAEQASAHARYPVDEVFVSSLLQRGQCRITLVALALVADRAGVDTTVLRAVLLPRARR